jgi:hypothetical protein
MTTTFRNSFRSRVPPAIAAGGGEVVLYVQNYLWDVMREVMRKGIELRFPSLTSDSGLALIGQDRGIVRGRSETKEHYAARLTRWRSPRGHRTRGSAFALLEQIWEYWGGIRCWTVNVNKSRHVRSFEGEESFSYAYPWDWDGLTSLWARFWFVLEPNPDRADILPWNTIGAGIWGNSLDPETNENLTIGMQGMTPEDWNAMRRLFKGAHIWKPAGTNQQFAIVYLGDYTSGTVPAFTGDMSDIHERIAFELAYPVRFVRLVRP